MRLNKKETKFLTAILLTCSLARSSHDRYPLDGMLISLDQRETARSILRKIQARETRKKALKKARQHAQQNP